MFQRVICCPPRFVFLAIRSQVIIPQCRVEYLKVCSMTWSISIQRLLYTLYNQTSAYVYVQHNTQARLHQQISEVLKRKFGNCHDSEKIQLFRHVACLSTQSQFQS